MEPKVDLSALEHSLRRPALERDLPRADLGEAQKKIVDVVSKAFYSESFATENSFLANAKSNQIYTVTFNWDFVTKSIKCTITREFNAKAVNIQPHKNQCIFFDHFVNNHGRLLYGKKSNHTVQLLTSRDVNPVLKEVCETAINMINEKRSA